MMLSFFLSLIILYTSDYGCIGYSLDCTKTPNLCSYTNINCTEDEDCFIACNEQQSCISSTITCPVHGDCNIECDGYQACKDVTILSQHSLSGNVNIICTDSKENCLGIKVYGSNLDINDGNMNVLCNGALQSCMHSEIICPVTGNCLISCNEDKSCKHSNITGPVNGDLTVNCNGESSCFGSIFNAKQSHQIDISGCIAIDSCLDLSIYCPPNVNHTAYCFIQGNDNIGSGTKIYAIHGWEDIQIDYSGNFALNHNGIMYCGTNYDISCEIAANEWKCLNSDDVNMCNVNLNGFVSTVSNLPDLSNDFEHGTMGMIVIGGGLIAVAIGCILCGVVKQIMSKIETATIPKENQDTDLTKSSTQNKHHHVEAIISGEEPSYEDAHGVIHHQHNQHERKLSSLHDRPKL